MFDRHLAKGVNSLALKNICEIAFDIVRNPHTKIGSHDIAFASVVVCTGVSRIFSLLLEEPQILSCLFRNTSGLLNVASRSCQVDDIC